MELYSSQSTYLSTLGLDAEQRHSRLGRAPHSYPNIITTRQNVPSQKYMTVDRDIFAGKIFRL